MNERLFAFVGGERGLWQITQSIAVTGEPLPLASRLDIVKGESKPEDSSWVLRGVTSNERYVTRTEREHLVSSSPPLGRPPATVAALIPIRKSNAWWALGQDERRAIFEEQSHHIAIGHRYLPAVARRLHHCRDLGEPFDFLTWFEFSPADAGAFERLVGQLRETEEWKFVEREVDIRLQRAI